MKLKVTVMSPAHQLGAEMMVDYFTNSKAIDRKIVKDNFHQVKIGVAAMFSCSVGNVTVAEVRDEPQVERTEYRPDKADDNG